MEARLREYFYKYGEVLQAVIMKHKVTGRPRGFVFIVFADPPSSTTPSRTSTPSMAERLKLNRLFLGRSTYIFQIWKFVWLERYGRWGSYGGGDDSYGSQGGYGFGGLHGGGSAGAAGGGGDQGSCSGYMSAGCNDAYGGSGYVNSWRSDPSQVGASGASRATQVNRPPSGPTSNGGYGGAKSRQAAQQ